MKKAFLQLHIAVFLAGFTAILGKLIGLNEGILVWYRLSLTVLTLGLILYFRKELERVASKDVLKILGVGAIVGIHWVLFYGSVKYANVSVGVVCLAAAGFFTSFFEPLILKRKISMIEVLLGVLTIIGIYIIFDFHPQYKLGIIFGILATVCSSLFPIFNKKLVESFSPRILTLYELSGGLVVLSILMPFYLAHFPAAYYLPTPADWVWLLVLAWLCTILAFDLQLNALKKISAFTASLTYNLEPVYGIMFGFLLFHENKLFNWHFYLGVGLILLSIIFQMIRVFRANRQKQV
jgi:drug/metabolite transporter (DMT)-like permease